MADLSNPTPLNVPGPQTLSTLAPLAGSPAGNLPSTPPPALPVPVVPREDLPAVTVTPATSSGPSYTSVIEADTPFLWWRFNDVSPSGTVVDSSGNGRDGTIVAPGSTEYQQPGLITEPDQTSIGATDNANFFVTSAPSVWTIAATAFSLEWWGTCVPLALLQNFFGVSLDSPDGVEIVCVDNTGAIEIIPTTANTPIATAAGIFAVSGRNHYVLTINGTAIKFYKNGNLIVNDTMLFAIPGNVNGAGFGSLAAGGAPPGNYGGFTDEFALYDYVLTQPQVVAHHN